MKSLVVARHNLLDAPQQYQTLCLLGMIREWFAQTSAKPLNLVLVTVCMCTTIGSTSMTGTFSFPTKMEQQASKILTSMDLLKQSLLSLHRRTWWRSSMPFAKQFSRKSMPMVWKMSSLPLFVTLYCRSSCPVRLMSLLSSFKPLNYRLAFGCSRFYHPAMREQRLSAVGCSDSVKRFRPLQGVSY